MGIESLQLKPSLHRPHLHSALFRLSHEFIAEGMSDKEGNRSPIGRRRCQSAELKSTKSSRRGRSDKDKESSRPLPLPREVRDKLDSKASRRGTSSTSRKEKRDDPPPSTKPKHDDTVTSACEELTSMVSASNAAYAAAGLDYGGSESGDCAVDAEPPVASGDSKKADSKAVPAKRDSGAMDGDSTGREVRSRSGRERNTGSDTGKAGASAHRRTSVPSQTR